MDRVSREDLSVRARDIYMDSFISVGVIFSFYSGICFLLFLPFGAPFWLFGSLFSAILLGFSGIQPYLYKKNKVRILTALEKQQALALEYRENPHVFVKKNLGSKGRVNVEQVVINIEGAYSKNPDNSLLDFEKLYEAIKCNDKNDVLFS